MAEHHLVLAAVSPLPFILLSLIDFSWISGAAADDFSTFWYLILLFYLFSAVAITFAWIEETFG
ncbi:hypothetical protein GCM10007108_07180 [Thermogymnomonas acidicola]|uniref:Uncharacterized protein n=1 Tax=Thermogymnomonas acidicola TaxID=399579 RepID=A0AA37F9C2_9ARCH|nr:hypothetical protein [Thermogymnomonas acidicola]GGM71631.1 hypothetical protein GCM10007108_07180 [Thermogymnomonas acidicola]